MFSDGFLFVFGEFFEPAFAIKDLPEFVHDVDQGSAVNQCFEPMDEVVDDWGAYFGVVNDFGVVKADDVGFG